MKWGIELGFEWEVSCHFSARLARLFFSTDIGYFGLKRIVDVRFYSERILNASLLSCVLAPTLMESLERGRILSNLTLPTHCIFFWRGLALSGKNPSTRRSDFQAHALQGLDEMTVLFEVSVWLYRVCIVTTRGTRWGRG